MGVYSILIRCILAIKLVQPLSASAHPRCRLSQQPHDIVSLFAEHLFSTITRRTIYEADAPTWSQRRVVVNVCGGSGMRWCGTQYTSACAGSPATVVNIRTRKLHVRRWSVQAQGHNICLKECASIHILLSHAGLVDRRCALMLSPKTSWLYSVQTQKHTTACSYWQP